jgi:replicative DNA helicase Mcm
MTENLNYNSINVWAHILNNKYKESLLELEQAFPEMKSLYINYRDIVEFDEHGPQIATDLLNDPTKVIDDVRKAIKNNNLLPTIEDKVQSLNVRFINLPRQLSINEIRTSPINTLVSFEGIVSKTSKRCERVIEAVYRCPAGHFTTVNQKGYSSLTVPTQCNFNDCKLKGLELVISRSKVVDSQLVWVIEAFNNINGGEEPDEIVIDFTHDLTDQVTIGDRIIVTGIIRADPRKKTAGNVRNYEVYLEASSLDIPKPNNELILKEPNAIKKFDDVIKTPEFSDRLMSSFAPTIPDHNSIKEAVIFQLLGHTNFQRTLGSEERTDIHILIVGAGENIKSDLLAFIKMLVPRVVCLSGKEVSKETLFATRKKIKILPEDVLKAGVFPLANDGLLFINGIELLKKDEDYEFIEMLDDQQTNVILERSTIKINSNCSLLAFANLRHNAYDSSKLLEKQLNIDPKLLAAFDLVFLIRDEADQNKDRALSKQVLSIKSGSYRDNQFFSNIFIRDFIKYARSNVKPVLSNECREFLREYYVTLRQECAGSDTIHITLRHIHVLLRLAHASARFRLSDDISVEDGKRAIRIMENGLMSVDPNFNHSIPHYTS